MSKKYYIFVQDIHEEPREIFARSKADAAMQWVKQYERYQCDFSIASGKEDIIVCVFTEEEYDKTPEISWLHKSHEEFLVKGEMQPSYCVEKLAKI